MKKYSLLLCVILVLSSCSSASYLTKPKDFKYQIKGLFIETTLKDESITIGEIIEVDSVDIKILPLYQKNGIQTITKDEIQSAEVIIALTSDDSKKISTWAGLLNVLSIGHGYFGALTLPVNLAITIPMANDAAKGTYRVKYPDNITWYEMSKFARFPQGIPKNIAQNDIK
jgi:hypothetical protein